MMDAAAIILAGGESRRMGRPKALLDWHGKPLIQHIAEQLTPHFQTVIISANEPEPLQFLGLPVVPDAAPGQGPLMGLSSALTASAHDWNFVTTCDRPEIPLALVQEMYARREGHECVVPVYPDGTREPLFGFYCRGVAETARRVLAGEKGGVKHLLDVCRISLMSIRSDDILSFNTEAEYWQVLQVNGVSRM